MVYTARFAHLEEAPALKVGDEVKRGDTIGIMGSTGASTGAHLHLDVVHGVQRDRYRQEDIEADAPMAAPRQCALFVDAELFGVDPVITTGYADPVYLVKFKKLHMGFDVVPEDRHRGREHYAIKWNRSMPGRVVAILDDPKGYGYCVYISFRTA